MLELVKYLYGLLVTMFAFGLLTLLGVVLAFGFNALTTNWFPISILMGALVICIVLAKYFLKKLADKV